MEPSLSDLSSSISKEAFAELSNSWRKIEHCIGQLDDDQLWSRPTEDLNSIANVLLHLNGNLGQWIISGIGGAEDIRNRPLEFSQREPIPREQLVGNLRQTLDLVEQTLTGLAPAEWLRPRCIQGFDVTGLQALFETVAHFRGHSQEIVHMTRRLLGTAYKFDFVPQTSEQGAPADSTNE